MKLILIFLTLLIVGCEGRVRVQKQNSVPATVSTKAAADIAIDDLSAHTPLDCGWRNLQFRNLLKKPRDVYACDDEIVGEVFPSLEFGEAIWDARCRNKLIGEYTEKLAAKKAVEKCVEKKKE